MPDIYFYRRSTVFVGVLATLGAASVAGQVNGSTPMVLQRRGMEVLEAGIAAVGGRSAITAANTVGLRVQVAIYAAGQGASPTADSVVSIDGPLNMGYLLDLVRDHRVYEVYASDTATQADARLVFTSRDKFISTPSQNTVQGVTDMSPFNLLLRGISYAPATLLDAMSRAASIRRLGDQARDGIRCRVITYADASGQQTALYFDVATDLLRRVEVVESHEQLGDHVVELRYDDYRRVGGLNVPHTVSVYTAGSLSSVTSLVDVDLAARLTDAVLRRPDGADELPAITGGAPNPDMEVTELGRGVYAIMDVTGGYNMMFADHGDHVFVIEAPVSTAVTRVVLEKIEETLPGKPVRYALITHYHYDHSGGLWGFMTEGVTVVATPGNEQFVYDIAAAPRTLDCEAPLAGKPRVELVTGTRTFGIGDQRVELYEVGPNPHVDELLIAYVPALKLVYVADVYNYAGRMAPADKYALSLAAKLEELNLEIERIIPSHGREATGEQFWESVRLGRESLSSRD